ncbi:MAG TPA: EF-hand domain-containing protein [Casimicrobiaceae bacterium]|nr:EF-hand domain-containing protein [Casimicrobiaceae bacterium]
MRPRRAEGVSVAGGFAAGWYSRRELALASAALALVVGGVPSVHAATAQSPPATIETTIRDPWVPPELRTPAPTPAPQGAALRAQVERKLKAGFDGADVNRSGTVTRDQARAAGLGYIVRQFDDIDRQRAGAVSFDDVKRFLRGRGAQLD